MIPVAALQRGSIKLIELSETGWRNFDSLYTRSGASYSLYRDGQPVGTVQVRQGMWENNGEPLYTLPSCKQLTPLASVGVQTSADVGYTLELMASGAHLGTAATAPVNDPSLQQKARAIAYEVGADASIQKSQLESLNFRWLAIHTGATAEPTVIASFINEQGDADAGSGRAVHVFAVADLNAAGGYRPTFSFAANGPASTAEYRRYIDHLDLTGDGVDELVLEGWKSGGDTFLSILGYENGTWSEVFRGRSSWCLDPRGPR